ncbi:MAG: NAD(P)-dependent oxidoreductase [Candidatus Manganitrophus sp. SA1]|nr:NAD(P)-dependent oxidoreductase [Candidatus Manganitrophus morganii]
MRCLVTGASGQLGSFLTRLLVRKGHEVAVLVRPQSDLWRISDLLPQVKLIYGDLSAVDKVTPQIGSVAPETVFHIAWYGVTREYRDGPEQIDPNLVGSIKLLQVALKSGCHCWVGIGSQEEYGPYDGVLREELPPKPVTTYGVAKLCTGLLSRQLCEMADTRFLWFRLLATYGPKDDFRHFIPGVILKLLAFEKPALTSGEQKWDYLYVEDACRAIYHAVLHPSSKGIFNLASGEAYSVRSIAEQIRDLIDPSLSLGFGEVADCSGQRTNLQADVSRLKAIGWAPKVSLEEGLRTTVSWYKTYRSPLAV